MRGMIFLGRDFTPGDIRIENGIIAGISTVSVDELNAAERENFIIPGLVDIHLHGCMGVDFCDSAADETIVGKMVAYERSVGVTSICPTTMTYDEQRLTGIMKSASSYVRACPEDSGVEGIHLEGPFISYEKRGAQNPAYIMAPDVAMVRRLSEASGGLVRQVDIAPETEGAMECIRELSVLNVECSCGIHTGAHRIQCSIAHTAVDYDTAMAAIQAGANHVTHLYNAMPPFLSRTPGVVGAAFDDKSTYVELICDGIHVHPATVRATYEMFGADRVILISDSMEACGMPDGEYELGGQKVIKKGHLATLSDGTIAGSVTNLFDCMKTAIRMGVPKEDAIISATRNPAVSLGLNDVGEIAVGKRANLLICDSDINLKEVITN